MRNPLSSAPLKSTRPVSAEAQARILQERHPLGRILKESNIDFVSRPQGFLRIASDSLMHDLLKLNQTQLLFGRRNTL